MHPKIVWVRHFPIWKAWENRAPLVYCAARTCPMRLKEPVKHSRYKNVIDGLIMEADHLWLKSCIAGQTENPLIKIPSTHGGALKSNRVLEIFELQSQVELVILLRMGEWIYNTLRRPKPAVVIHKKKVPSQHTSSVGTFSAHHSFAASGLIIECEVLSTAVCFLWCLK